MSFCAQMCRNYHPVPCSDRSSVENSVGLHENVKLCYIIGIGINDNNQVILNSKRAYLTQSINNIIDGNSVICSNMF